MQECLHIGGLDVKGYFWFVLEMKLYRSKLRMPNLSNYDKKYGRHTYKMSTVDAKFIRAMFVQGVAVVECKSDARARYLATRIRSIIYHRDPRAADMVKISYRDERMYGWSLEIYTQPRITDELLQAAREAETVMPDTWGVYRHLEERHDDIKADDLRKLIEGDDTSGLERLSTPQAIEEYLKEKLKKGENKE